MARALIIPAFEHEVINREYRNSYFKTYLPADTVIFPDPEYTLQVPGKFPSLQPLNDFIRSGLLNKEYSLIIGEVRSGFLWSTLLRLHGINTPALIFARVNPFEINDLVQAFLFSQVCLPCDSIVTGSESSAGTYSCFGFNTFISHQGIDFSEYYPAEISQTVKQELGLTAYKNIFIYTGRMAPDKSVLELVEFFMNNGLPETVLIIATVITDRDYYEKCREKAAGSDKIKFYFNLNYHQLNKLYNIADYFISFSTSYYESFGRAPLEALACGTPVIVPDYNGFREYFIKGCGFLVEKKMVNGRWEVDQEDARTVLKAALADKVKIRQLSLKARESKTFPDKKKMTGRNIKLARQLSAIKPEPVNFVNHNILLDKYPDIIREIFKPLENMPLREALALFLQQKENIISYTPERQDRYYRFIFRDF